MLNRKYMKSIFLPLILLTLTSNALALGITERCREDQLSIPEALGRNAWARKCGYIKSSTEAAYNDEQAYMIFSIGKKGGSPDIPVSEGAACLPGLTKMGACMAGCYSPTQRLTFNGLEMEIAQAFEWDQPTVSALRMGSTRNSLRYGEQKIRAFIAGETDENLFILRADNGRRLEVTSEHPMVLATGEVVKARSLKTGDLLMTESGALTALTAIERKPYKGRVWNLQPQSQNRLENILVAEGFLTGSVRFQNEWADELYRLSLRDELSLDNLTH